VFYFGGVVESTVQFSPKTEGSRHVQAGAAAKVCIFPSGNILPLWLFRHAGFSGREICLQAQKPCRRGFPAWWVFCALYLAQVAAAREASRSERHGADQQALQL
jgi:hypothetical protein